MAELVSKLGKVKVGCIYIRNLSDVDHDVLVEQIRATLAEWRH